MRTIRVTGKGKIKVKPDMTRLTITLEDTCPEYSETLKKSNEVTEQVKDLFVPFGFEKSDLKTLSFNVDTEYESYNDHGTYKQRFLGYSYKHVLKVEFEFDNKRLGKILYALANSPLQPEFRLSYTVKDPEAVKNKLLGKAVLDAKEKAAVLTQAADVTLKDIQSIDYSWGEIDFVTKPMNEMRLMECTECEMSAPAAYDIDIEADDIDVTDTVTVVWEIA